MTKVFWFFPVIASVLCIVFRLGDALECYNCYVGEFHYRGEPLERAAEFLPCNVWNFTESNVWTCPHPNSKCVYRKLQFESTKNKLVLRTCSSGLPDPCETQKVLPGVNLLECRFCSSNRCNFGPNESEVTDPYNTVNINANINLYVRRG